MATTKQLLDEVRANTFTYPDGYVHIRPELWFKILDIIKRYDSLFADMGLKKGDYNDIR